MDGKLRNMTSLYLRQGDRLLLLYRVGSGVVADSYIGTAGGHFEKDELNDARACVLRELYEETGLAEADIRDLRLRYVTLRLKNGELRQNYYFFAELPQASRPFVSNEGRLKWFDLRALEDPQIEMPFSARYVVIHYARTGKDTDALYIGASAASGVVFTEIAEF